jgi:hypothetical protein
MVKDDSGFPKFILYFFSAVEIVTPDTIGKPRKMIGVIGRDNSNVWAEGIDQIEKHENGGY